MESMILRMYVRVYNDTAGYCVPGTDWIQLCSTYSHDFRREFGSFRVCM